MPNPPVDPANVLSSRKGRIGLSVLVAAVAMLSLVVMANYLGARHYWRWSGPAASGPSLSPLTLQILDALTNRVQVIVLYDSREPLYAAVVRLLNEYQHRAPRHIDLELVNFMFNPGRADLISSEYKLGPAEDPNRVIFAHNGQVRVVHDRELSEWDYDAALRGEEVRRTAFKGERLFTSALFTVINPRPVKAYFLWGHGEYDPASQDDRYGYLRLSQLLSENNVTWTLLTSLHLEEVPEDCDLLIVADPLNVIPQIEIERIERYLGQGGRLLALFGHRGLEHLQIAESSYGLEKILARWGVEVGYDFVMDEPQHHNGARGVLVVNSLGSHPVVKPLQNGRLLLPICRSVGRMRGTSQSADASRVTELAFTSAAGRTLGRVERIGPIPLAVAVEKGAVPGIASDRGATRMVVVGSGLFLSNFFLQWESNRDFARHALNWLLNRELLLEGIGTQAIKEYRITMTAAELQAAQWTLAVLLPAGALLAGLIVWLRRRF